MLEKERRGLTSGGKEVKEGREWCFFWHEELSLCTKNRGEDRGGPGRRGYKPVPSDNLVTTCKSLSREGAR